MANVIFKVGTKAQYDALTVKDSNTLYWLTDVLELRKGEVLYGKGAEATNLASGLMSAADKAKLDSLSETGGGNLTAVDSTLVITNGANGKTIGVQISNASGNALEVKEDGLFVSVGTGSEAVEFSIEKQAGAAEGFAATYKLKRTAGGEVTYVGDAINIPRDLILNGGTLETVATANTPYDGAEVGDPYIDLVLSDADSTHIYIPLKGLLNTVAAGDGIKVENNTASVKLDTGNANGLAVGPDGLSLAAATATSAGAMSKSDKANLDAAVSSIEELKNSIVWAEIGEG